MKLIKENNKWKTYDEWSFKILYRSNWSIAWDNSENVKELIYLITWTAEITLKDDTWVLKSPAKIEFPEKTYHKIKALTDISFILFES